jgi:glyoxalase family protein
MPYPILGLHHVTATVDEAQPDLDFCEGALGLRLVKKTVNFDNRHVYHFYYGDERGSPGTIWTTFPYHGRNVRVGTKGAGQVTVTSFSVPEGSLDFWRSRLKEHGTSVRDAAPRFGEESIVAVDPSGLAIELVANERDARPGWNAGEVPPAAAVRGLHSVSLSVQSPGGTVDLLTDLLGFQQVNEEEGRIRMAVSADLPGRTVDIIHDPDLPRAANGLGTVHHVAFAIETEDDQRRLREELIRRGINVTEVMDRQYFRSIYFREPGGVLFEVATIQPGFTFDEPLACLGQDLKLPPWEEPNRPAIEAGLAKVTVRAASGLPPSHPR